MCWKHSLILLIALPVILLFTGCTPIFAVKVVNNTPKEISVQSEAGRSYKLKPGKSKKVHLLSETYWNTPALIFAYTLPDSELIYASKLAAKECFDEEGEFKLITLEITEVPEIAKSIVDSEIREFKKDIKIDSLWSKQDSLMVLTSWGLPISKEDWYKLYESNKMHGELLEMFEKFQDGNIKWKDFVGKCGEEAVHFYKILYKSHKSNQE